MAPTPNLLDLICPAPDGIRLRFSPAPFCRGYRSCRGKELCVWSDPSNSIMPQSDSPEIDPPVEVVLSHLENRGTDSYALGKRSLGGLKGGVQDHYLIKEQAGELNGKAEWEAGRRGKRENCEWQQWQISCFHKITRIHSPALLALNTRCRHLNQNSWTAYVASRLPQITAF